MLAEQLPNLRTVVIRETSVTGVGIEALSRGLRTLQLLDIGFNTISGGGELVVHPELETLYMGYMDDRLCDDWLLRQGWPFRAAQCPPLRQSFRQENNLQHIGGCVCVRARRCRRPHHSDGLQHGRDAARILARPRAVPRPHPNLNGTAPVVDAGGPARTSRGTR